MKLPLVEFQVAHVRMMLRHGALPLGSVAEVHAQDVSDGGELRVAVVTIMRPDVVAP